METTTNPNESKSQKGGPFISFILLEEPFWDKNECIQNLMTEWGIHAIETTTQDDKHADVLLAESDGMMFSIGYLPSPVPHNEAEKCAATNFYWPEAVKETEKHKAHVIVAVFPKDHALTDAACLLVKLCDTCSIPKHVLGVYSSGTVFHPASYRDSAKDMKTGDFPIFNLIFFGFFRTERDCLEGYTYGLFRFGKKEIEIPDCTAEPDDLLQFMVSVSEYILSTDTDLNDGDTIGTDAGMKLPITVSEGTNVVGLTCKIAYKTRKPKNRKA